MKKILWIVGLFLLLIAGTGLYLLNMPKASIENKTVDVSIHAAALYNEYSGDEKTSNQKYIGKVVETSGNILELSKDEMGADVILLAAGNAPGGILCTLEKGQSIDSLKNNDLVKIKGQCTGMLMDVVLNKCIIVK